MITIFDSFKELTYIEDYCPGGGVIIPVIPADFAEAFEAMASESKKQIVVIPAGAPISEKHRKRASRVAAIVRELLHAVIDLPGEPPETISFRFKSLSIESISIGSYSFLMQKSSDDSAGLSRDRMRQIAALTAETAHFLKDFCRCPTSFSSQNQEEARKPLEDLLKKFVKSLLPLDKEARIEIHHLTALALDLLLRDIVTPAFITRILLSLEFPYGGGAQEEGCGAQELKKIGKEFPQESENLGEAILDCIDILLENAWERETRAQEGLDKVASLFKKTGTKVGTFALRAFKKSIGVYVFASINAALRSETSTAMSIIELALKNRKAVQVIEEKDLKAKLQAAIPAQLTKVVFYLINDEVRQMKSGGDKAKAVLEVANLEKLIGMVSPLLVELVWDRSFPLSHLISGYLPKAILPHLSAPKTADPKEKVKDNGGSRRIVSLALRFATDYLFPQIEPVNAKVDFRQVFLGFFKITLRKALEGPKSAPSRFAEIERIRTLGFLITAANRFLASAIERRFVFSESRNEIERPLKSLAGMIAKLKYPQDQGAQELAAALGIEAVNITIDKLLNPILLCNLILKVKLDYTEKSPAALEETFIPQYDSLGLEAVRLLRTLMRLGNNHGKLGWFDQMIAFGARRFRSLIGSQIALGLRTAAKSNEGSLLDLIEKFLWRPEGKQLEPVLFEGWETTKEALSLKFEKWIHGELFPFLSKVLAQQELGGTMTSMIESNLRPSLKLIATRIFNLLWLEDNKALRIFIFHYLLVIFHKEIAAAIVENK